MLSSFVNKILPSHEEIIKEQKKKHNNAHFMLVDGMSKLTTQQVKKVQSSDFYVFGLKWNLLVCSGEVKDFVSLYLVISDKQCVGSNWEVRCSFKLSVVSRIGLDISTTFLMRFNAKQEMGGNQRIVQEMLKLYTVDDKAIFCAEIIEAKPSFPVTSISRVMGTAEHLKLMDVSRNKSKFTWKITKFSSFDSNNHSSYEFTVGSRRWKLDMYPNGDSGGAGHLSLFLTATNFVTNGPKGATLAVYKLRVLDQLKRNHHETHHEAWFQNDPADTRLMSWGQSKFLPHDELYKASRGLLVNDAIYIGVEFLYISTTENL